MNELAPSKQTLPKTNSSELLAGSLKNFELSLKEAEIWSKSDIIPGHFRDKPANVLIAVELAHRTGLSVFGVMQKTYIIHGRPAFETQLAIALLNVSGLIRGTIEFERVKNPAGMAATVVDAKTGRPQTHILTWETVKKSGWADEGHWLKDPTLMMKYRSAMQLIRTHYPEVILGLHTVEEALEMRNTDPNEPDFDSSSLYEPKTTDAIAWEEPAAQQALTEETKQDGDDVSV